MSLAEPPAVEDYLVAGLPARMGGRLHRAGEIDAGDHGKAAHHRRLAGEREPILVVQRRIFHADGDVALHQFPLVEIGEPDGLAGFRLVDNDRLEGAHAPAPALTFFRGRLWPAGDASRRAVWKTRTPGTSGYGRAAAGRRQRTDALRSYAAKAAGRAPVFRTIGKLMTADRRPNRIASHHPGS